MVDDDVCVCVCVCSDVQMLRRADVCLYVSYVLVHGEEEGNEGSLRSMCT